MTFIKKNLFSIIIGILLIVVLIICLATAFPLSDKLQLVSDETVYGSRVTIFEYKYNGNKTIPKNLVYGSSEFATWLVDRPNTVYESFKKGDIIRIKVDNWDGEGKIYLYFGDKILAKY